MIVRSCAPLRLCLAGGRTDVVHIPTSMVGAILNATITMYAYATIVSQDDGKIILNSIDRNTKSNYMVKKYWKYMVILIC